VQALAQSTRISANFIEALEEGAFEKLPGEVFGRGFVRSICKALNLDAEEMIATFDECWDHSGPRKSVLEVEIKERPFQRGALTTIAEALARRLRHGSSLGRFAGMALLAVLLAIGGWQASRLDLWKTLRKGPSQAAAPLVAEQAPPVSPGSADKPVEQPDSSAPKAAETSPVAAAPEASALAPTTAPAGGASSAAAASLAVEREGDGEQRLDLVVTESVRVRADVDGAGSQTKDYAPGTYQIQFKDKVEMMIYDAAALKISFNGKPLGPLGSKGRVRRISFQSTAPTTKKL
jgi:cytoskeleton protein RodZ